MYTEYNGDAAISKRRIQLIENIFSSQYFNFNIEGLSLLIDIWQKEPRGKIQWKNITLSSGIRNDWEFLQLFIHEFGHFVDLYLLKGNASADPSEEFYAIDWKTASIKKPGVSLSNFVSGYAASNKYEDFAESFTWYVFHNANFADRALKNESLRKKYLFIADNIFTHWEFQDTDFSSGKIPNYFWDTTKISISVQKYLNYIR